MHEVFNFLYKKTADLIIFYHSCVEIIEYFI
jgi:hypothetical protein